MQNEQDEDVNGKSRNWLGTWNNPTVAGDEWLSKLYTESKATYTVGQLEKGENGTPHIQFFLNFKEPVRFAKLKKLHKQSHWKVVKINNGAHTYCMKEETRLEGPWEYGVKPV